MATANAVEALHEADEAIQEDPVPAGPHPSTCSFPVNIPVPLPICHSPSSTGWQQEEASPPELQRVNQTMEAEEKQSAVLKNDGISFLFNRNVTE